MRVRLQVRAQRQPVGQASPVKAADRRRIGVAGAGEALRRQHARVDAKLAQPLRELRLVEEDVEVDALGATGIVGDGQLDVVRPLREGKSCRS